MVRRVLLVTGFVVAALGLAALGGWLGSERLAAGRRPSLASGLLAGLASSGSCCGGGQAGTAATSGATAAGSVVTAGSSALERAAVDTYRASTGDQSVVEAKVTDYGCHVQADIYRDGRRVRSYVLRRGQWAEIR